MRIATWNVNSINARLETVLAWFRQAAPDAAVGGGAGPGEQGTGAHP